MTNNPLQINKTDTQLTIQFPQGEKIPFMHLLIHWLTLTIAVFSLFLILYFLRWQSGLWFLCSFEVTYFLLPFYFFIFTPSLFLWNYFNYDRVELSQQGLRLYRLGTFLTRMRRSLSLSDIESVNANQVITAPFWTQWPGIRLFVLMRKGSRITVENKQKLTFHFGWNVTPEEAEEVARLMNEHLALLKGD